MEKDKLRILIVDDDQDILTLSEKLLKSSYEVLTVDNGRTALEILQSVQIDGLLSDINMPEMDGFELLRRIKKNTDWDHLTIAMLTGVRERKDIQKAIEMGVNDYIVKPIDPMLFLKKIENLFHDKESIKNEVHFVKIQMESPAYLKTKIRIITVSEMGLSIATKNEQEVGKIIELDFTLFSELGIKAPHLKVLSCKQSENKEWILHLGFVGASEAVLQKLRAWIYKQSTQNKAVA